ncbi:MAG: regulatory protein RecX [Gemmatimonadota bacterium]
MQPRITGLEPDPARPDAVRVVVNGKIFCTVPAATVATHGLAIGQPADGEFRDRTDRAADIEAAWRTLLRSLERRSFARHDLGRRLIRKGHPPEAVEAALTRADDAGLLDDAAFARQFVQSRAERGRGPARLTRDLQAMGIPRGLIDDAVRARWPEPADTTVSAEQVATRRAAQLKNLPPDVRRRRLLAYLGRRGFSGSAVSDIVRRLTRT